MDNLSAYLERLELIAFFSGFPLLYAFVLFLAGPAGNRSPFKQRVYSLLPYGYALAGLSYLGFALNNWYPNYSPGFIWNDMQMPFLKTWAFLSILFFIPALAKKPIFCLIHSLPFFYLVIRDLFGRGGDAHVVSNDMKLYTDSLLIQTGALLALFIIVVIYRHLRQYRLLARH